MRKSVRPRHDYIAVRRDKPKEKSDGGIVFANIAEDVSESAEWGVVIDCGPKAYEVKVGQRVLIGSFGGWTFKLDGEPVVLIKEGEVHAVEDAA